MSLSHGRVPSERSRLGQAHGLGTLGASTDANADPVQLGLMVQTQLQLATDPSRGQTAVQAARLVLAMLTAALPEGEDEVDVDAQLDAMPACQRAALRANPEGTGGGRGGKGWS